MLDRIRPRSRKQWIVVGLGGLLGACIVCGMISSLLPSQPKAPAGDDARAQRVATIALADTPIAEPTATAVLPTAVSTQEAVPTVVVTIPAAEPTAEPPTATPQPTATPVLAGPRASRAANLRAGPGTSYEVAGSAAADVPLEIVGVNPSGDWYQLATGAWIAAFLVADPPPGLPVVAVPTLPLAIPTAPPVPAGPATIGDLRLVVRQNARSNELIEIRNGGAGAIDIGGWVLYGSKGDEHCTIPDGTTLQAGQSYQVASGDSQPIGPGYKCSVDPMWSNEGEIIYLRSPDGQQIDVRT